MKLEPHKDDFMKQRAADIRRAILDIMMKNPEAPWRDVSLQRALDHLGYPIGMDEIDKYASEMADADLLSICASHFDAATVVTYKIGRKGLEAAEGRIKVSGVAVKRPE